MTTGFFPSLGGTVNSDGRRPLYTVPQCGACGLYKTCISPKMPVDGEGRKKILICAEAPGGQEDEQGKPLVGASGQLLQEALALCGIDMRKDCWLTNSVICHPKGNLLPPTAVDYCRPNVVEAVKTLNPKVILALGSVAVKSLFGWLWREDPGGVERWAGFQVPVQKINAWICPIYHPAAILRKRQQKGTSELWFHRHLQAATALKDRPWGDVPDYKKQIKVYLTPDTEVLDRIRVLCESEKPIAFDYETTCAKPEVSGAEIYSVSFSDGESAFAVPWTGKKLAGVVKEFLTSRVPKVASNLKFEYRWGLKRLGITTKGVTARNGAWDTMLAAHVLDNRPGICSIKFQAFRWLGVDAWDAKVKPYLKSVGSSPLNRIRECDLKELLWYNAMDSFYEFLVAEKQRKAIKEGV